MTINVTPDVTWKGDDVFQSTSVNMPIPASISAGMFMIVGLIFFGNQATVTIDGYTSSTPWTEMVTGGATRMRTFYKIADSGDATDSTAGSRSWTIHCIDGFIEQWAGAAWSGVDTSTPFATGPAYGNAVNTTFTFTSQTSPGSSSVWVGVFCNGGDPGTITDPSSPVVNQKQSTSPYFTAPAIVYSATNVTGAFSPTGTIGTAIEWTTTAFFLNPSGGGGGGGVISNKVYQTNFTIKRASYY